MRDKAPAIVHIDLWLASLDRSPTREFLKRLRDFEGLPTLRRAVFRPDRQPAASFVVTPRQRDEISSRRFAPPGDLHYLAQAFSGG